jgi:hypothetical protein
MVFGGGAVPLRRRCAGDGGIPGQRRPSAGRARPGDRRAATGSYAALLSGFVAPAQQNCRPLPISCRRSALVPGASAARKPGFHTVSLAPCKTSPRGSRLRTQGYRTVSLLTHCPPRVIMGALTRRGEKARLGEWLEAVNQRPREGWTRRGGTMRIERGKRAGSSALNAITNGPTRSAACACASHRMRRFSG